MTKLWELLQFFLEFWDLPRIGTQKLQLQGVRSTVLSSGRNPLWTGSSVDGVLCGRGPLWTGSSYGRGTGPHMEVVLIWTGSSYGRGPYMDGVLIWTVSSYGRGPHIDWVLIWTGPHMDGVLIWTGPHKDGVLWDTL
jgi:hypothetical protein